MLDGLSGCTSPARSRAWQEQGEHSPGLVLATETILAVAHLIMDGMSDGGFRRRFSTTIPLVEDLKLILFVRS